MSWEIITKTQTADFARVTEAQLSDLWYDIALGMVERFTGWRSLSDAKTVAEYVDGSGSSILIPNIPINTVTSVQVHGISLPSGYYYAAWNGIELRTYRPGEDFETTVWLERVTSFGEIFPFGLKNIYVDYNYGGTASLPSEYLTAVKSALLQIIKELSTVPRTEGSDSMLKKYRPDRTMNPEEVLQNYGVHGKINGILLATLPKKRLYGLRA